MSQKEVLTGNIAVFTAVRPGTRQQRQHAREVGRLIGSNGFGLVYGGIDSGLMHEVSVGAHETGAHIIGIVPTPEEDLDMVRGLSPLNDELVPTPSWTARKYTMLRAADAVIALAGGLGTYDEISTVMELSRGKAQTGAVSRLVLLNTDGFYDGLRMQLDRMQADRLIDVATDSIAYFAQTPQDAMAYIKRALPGGAV